MTAFERYIAAGGRRPGLWRVIAGVVLIAALWIGGTIGVFLLWGALNVARRGESEGALLGPGDGTLGGSPEVVAMMLLTFAGIWLGVILTVRLLHGQPFWSLFAPERRVRTGDLAKGLLVAVGCTALSLPAALTIAEPVPSGLSPAVWLVILPPIVALICVQATAEELMFRGYLLQQLALRSRSPLVWAVVPSALFGALHFTGTLPGTAGLLYIATTFLMGLALAVLVWRTGSLWASIGVHVGFNTVGLTLVGTEGVLSGAQLFLFPRAELPALMWIDLATTVLLLAFVLSPWAPFGPPRDEAARA